MPDLAKEQLAEGRRLLMEYQRHFGFVGREPLNARYAWWAWVDDHAASLLSAAEAKASAAEFAGACIAKAREHEARAIDAAKNHPMVDGKIAREEEAEVWCDVADLVKELAAQRGIELDATPAGEAEKGEV